MNEREDWNNRNPFSNWNDQFIYSSPEIPPTFGPSNNWLHVPPQTMPWGLPANSHPTVVRFTAGDLIPIHLHHPVKRKPEPDVELPPSKQLVTEEKMAAHMSNLHISDSEPQPPQLPNIPCDDDSMDQERLPKLLISDEIKNFKTEPIIPEVLLSKLERPKMALVLWQPPAGDLGSRLKSVTNVMDKKQEEEDEKKRDHDVDVDFTMEAENNNIDNTFRPIDPVPMLANQESRYLQPTPQFHGYFPYS